MVVVIVKLLDPRWNIVFQSGRRRREEESPVVSCEYVCYRAELVKPWSLQVILLANENSAVFSSPPTLSVQAWLHLRMNA